MRLSPIMLLLLLARPDRNLTLPPETRFLSSDWQTVYQAEFQLESSGVEALPKLMAILDRPESVPLTNTADLIYPGARIFYGHGWIIDYDLDRLAVRAGWALEELTFENFGFSEEAITEAQLLGAVKQGRRDVPLQDVTSTHSKNDRHARREAAIARAKQWYVTSGGGWSRYAGVKAALTSGDSFRQMKVLSWLRGGVTPCADLTVQKYRREILPLVTRLERTGSPAVREQASLLARDKNNDWWRSKTDPELRKWADPNASR